MKPAAFDYVSAASIPEAIALYAGAAGEARYLAGGQSLIPSLNFRLDAPDILIDLGRIAEMRGVREEDGQVVIGAMTRHAEIARDPLIARHLPLVAEAIRYVAHPAIRNRGTFGGSVALADPAAEMPACALALGAEMRIDGPSGPRRVPADDFFRGTFETAIEPGELLTHVAIPIPAPGASYGFGEIARRRGDYAMAGLCLTTGRGPRVVWFAVSDRPARARAAEEALRVGAGVEATAALATEGVEVFGDANASEAMKRHLARRLLAKTLRGMGAE